MIVVWTGQRCYPRVEGNENFLPLFFLETDVTTKNSPYADLKAQAVKMVAVLKDKNHPQTQKARQKDTCKTGIAMDDQIITIELSWTYIDGVSSDDLVEYIIRLMRGEKSDA